MQRDHWKFSFTAEVLAKAATVKLEWHQGRLKFWQDAKAAVMKDVKEEGIEVFESEAGGSYSNTNYGPKVMVRADLQTRLNECHSKIKEHTEKVAEYRGWVEVLEGNPKEILPLNADDYLFFFRK